MVIMIRLNKKVYKILYWIIWNPACRINDSNSLLTKRGQTLMTAWILIQHHVDCGLLKVRKKGVPLGPEVSSVNSAVFKFVGVTITNILL